MRASRGCGERKRQTGKNRRDADKVQRKRGRELGGEWIGEGEQEARVMGRGGVRRKREGEREKE